MTSAFDLQLRARVSLASYRCGLGDDYLDEAIALSTDSGLREDRVTAFLADEAALMRAYPEGLAMPDAIEQAGQFD
ncbi:hypothetical protein [Caballeronia sp. J97]|uniref:hypothetical protein n=1 Tax=Caballeronia sp. J97 TaxID=2805429 RepID=UPI002AAFA573|nr:hypothetical protein [Caballeronia sp. J97]